MNSGKTHSIQNSLSLKSIAGSVLFQMWQGSLDYQNKPITRRNFSDIESLQVNVMVSRGESWSYCFNFCGICFCKLTDIKKKTNFVELPEIFKDDSFHYSVELRQWNPKNKENFLSWNRLYLLVCYSSKKDITTPIPFICWYILIISRSSRPEVSYEKGSLKIFDKFTGKHLCWSLLQLYWKRDYNSCFPVNLSKLLREPFS